MKIVRVVVVVVALIGSAIWIGSSAGKPPAQAPTLRDRMVGTWKLESRVTKGADGSMTSLKGWDGAPGYISYTNDGYMSVQFMQLNRTKEEGTNGYLAYFGTYTVDESTRTVSHHIIGDINPDAVGGTQSREVVMEGSDKMSLRLHSANSPNISINSFTRMK